MSVRSHWISVVVFFVCGVLTGGVVENKLDFGQPDRSRELRELYRDHGITLTTRSSQAMTSMGEAGIALAWLELEAAGQTDTAVALAEMQVRAAMSRMDYQREPYPEAFSGLRSRWEDWQAGRPWPCAPLDEPDIPSPDSADAR